MKIKTYPLVEGLVDARVETLSRDNESILLKYAGDLAKNGDWRLFLSTSAALKTIDVDVTDLKKKYADVLGGVVESGTVTDRAEMMCDCQKLGLKSKKPGFGFAKSLISMAKASKEDTRWTTFAQQSALLIQLKLTEPDYGHTYRKEITHELDKSIDGGNWDLILRHTTNMKHMGLNEYQKVLPYAEKLKKEVDKRFTDGKLNTYVVGLANMAELGMLKRKKDSNHQLPPVRNFR